MYWDIYQSYVKSHIPNDQLQLMLSHQVYQFSSLVVRIIRKSGATNSYAILVKPCSHFILFSLHRIVFSSTPSLPRVILKISTFFESWLPTIPCPWRTCINSMYLKYSSPLASPKASTKSMIACNGAQTCKINHRFCTTRAKAHASSRQKKRS